MTGFFLASLASGQSSAWYDNGWIIGIVTGLASGALLAAATPIFLRKRRARDLAIRRERTADDVLSALRPSVATGYLPSAAMVNAITRANAYRRGLDPRSWVPVVGTLAAGFAGLLIFTLSGRLSAWLRSISSDQFSGGRVTFASLAPYESMLAATAMTASDQEPVADGESPNE